ncbi:putative inorganic phosphate cotransporter isoform X1 [Neodiprion virginianus]|uniref:putative inorganic phosphate cotransporter isoform X1 n=2 Tax=Neodiprion virginianus TaxID=2961670 RepID=UPI001EE72773|nr:putative inorganic phosphate cotransporter isoform X1 [Neodiprion virginianus]
MFHTWKTYFANVPQRWVFAVMGCLAVSNAFSMRICLNLAITKMVSRVKTSSNFTILDDTCPAPEGTVHSSSNGDGTYDWDEYTQGIILSSFFWGYIITQIPGGILADKFGGKYTLGIGILSTAIFTMLTPLVVETFDATGLIVLRVLMGLGEGTTFPAANSLVAQWAPPEERSKISTVVMSGMQVGTVLGTSLSGVLIHNFSIGWPVVFYFFGGIGALWFPVWVVLCYSYPDTHPFISDQEKEFLRERMSEHTHKQTAATPWRRILTSAPMWALMIGKVGENFGFQTMVTDLPKYMSSVLKFSIQTNGFLSALPLLAMWLGGIGSSWIADWMIKKDKISRTNLRKVCATIAAAGPAGFLVGASYAGCDRTIVVILFTLGMGLMGFIYPSTMVNGLDLSPNYSGSLTAMTTTIVAIAGIAAPYAVGVLTPNQTLSEWRTVFWITFAVYLISVLIYDLWADGEVQDWNDPGLDEKTNKEEAQRRKQNSDIPLSGRPVQKVHPA